jgi:hypothetical protein
VGTVPFERQVMQASSSFVVVTLLAVAFTACGGDTRKKSAAAGGGPGSAAAGMGALDQADAGAEAAGAGNGSTEEAGRGGASAPGGAGGVATTGGSSGASNSGGRLAAGAGPAAGSGGAGAPAGGGPGAGTSSMGGADNGTVIEPPPDCASVSQSKTADTCSYEYACEGRSHFDSCRREGDAAWACECGTFSTPTRYFELDGVEVQDACGVIARVCETDLPASPARTCTTKEQSVDGETCSAHATCGHALDLEPGIVVREVEHYRSKCKLADNYIEDAYDCSCEGGVFDRGREVVTAPSIDDVCAPMLEYCTSGMKPAFNEPVCAYADPSGAVDPTCPTNTDCFGCLMYQECGKAGQLARDVAMVSFEDATHHYVVCLPDQGELDCSCRATNEGLYGDASISQAVLDVCRSARAVCGP